MQLDMFGDLDNSDFEIQHRKHKYNDQMGYVFEQLMIPSIAMVVMLNLERGHKMLHDDFPEYEEQVLDFMATHDNKACVAEYFNLAEKLVSMGYWKRYVANYKIKYQNPRSYAGNKITSKIPVVCYGNKPDDMRLCEDKFQTALALLCGQALEYQSRTVTQWVESHEEVIDIFQYLTKKIKAISPRILEGRGKVYG